ncbi:hypothetical protein FORMB_25730 [Formosa sp. Hel1_33_131]|nr:hypothetical protein FORMB_25730 [Formosa sp. Hel1_33_131]
MLVFCLNIKKMPQTRRILSVFRLFYSIFLNTFIPEFSPQV